MVTAILKRKWKKANVAENNVFCNLALLQKNSITLWQKSNFCPFEVFEQYKF